MTTLTPTAADEKPREELVDGLSWDHKRPGLFLTYSDEASVRRALATVARASGWAIVREEVVIPGWGRVDLVLQAISETSRPHLVELKLDLRRPSDVRKAFQQADGYGRWWLTEYSVQPTVHLAPCTGDAAAITAVMKAYPSIQVRWVGDLMQRLPVLGIDAADRIAIAEERLLELERRVRLHQYALEIMRGESGEELRQEVRREAAAEEFNHIFSSWVGIR